MGTEISCAHCLEDFLFKKIKIKKQFCLCVFFACSHFRLFLCTQCGGMLQYRELKKSVLFKLVE